MATVDLGWSPAGFWQSTPAEFYAALSALITRRKAQAEVVKRTGNG